MYQITAPHFVAAFYNDQYAPIIKYMKGWSIEKVQEYCNKKGWEVKRVN